MAAAVSGELHMPVNRKKMRRIFHRLSWIEPAKSCSGPPCQTSCGRLT
ncbi:MAG: hypothetical protein ACK4TO_00240 [Candidatus Nitrosotenuis sp.]